MTTILMLLTSVLKLLTMVSANPNLPQSFKDSVMGVASSAIVEAQNEISKSSVVTSTQIVTQTSTQPVIITPVTQPVVQPVIQPVVSPSTSTVTTGSSGTVAVQESGISGTVLIGPTCPVQSAIPDPNCADRPYQTNLVLISSGGTQTVKEFSSDASGHFSMTVPAGQYYIQSAPNTTGIEKISGRCHSDLIQVVSNQNTSTSVSCDSGMR